MGNVVKLKCMLCCSGVNRSAPLETTAVPLGNTIVPQRSTIVPPGAALMPHGLTPARGGTEGERPFSPYSSLIIWASND